MKEEVERKRERERERERERREREKQTIDRHIYRYGDRLKEWCVL